MGPIKPTRFLHALAAAAAAALLCAPAHGQTLLDDLLAGQEGLGSPGVCTCTTIEPPNDCQNAAPIQDARARASESRGEVRAQCARDWTARCEEEYGWQACASAEAQASKNEQCDALVEQWWAQVAQPQLNDIAAQCRAANEQFTNTCINEIRPQECVSCEAMEGEIAQLEGQIAETRSWLARMRSGEVVLTPNDEVLIGQRADELDRLERTFREKQNAYVLLQDTEFCPSTSS